MILWIHILKKTESCHSVYLAAIGSTWCCHCITISSDGSDGKVGITASVVFQYTFPNMIRTKSIPCIYKTQDNVLSPCIWNMEWVVKNLSIHFLSHTTIVHAWRFSFVWFAFTQKMYFILVGVTYRTKSLAIVSFRFGKSPAFNFQSIWNGAYTHTHTFLYNVKQNTIQTHACHAADNWYLALDG